MIRTLKHQVSVSRLAAAALLAMAASAPAIAQEAANAVTTTTLQTSALWSDPGQSYPACNVTNVTSAAVAVKIVLYDSSDHVISSSGASPVSIAAGHTYEQSASGNGDFTFCRIRTTAPAASLRANLTIFHYTGAYYESLAVSEAR